MRVIWVTTWTITGLMSLALFHFQKTQLKQQTKGKKHISDYLIYKVMNHDFFISRRAFFFDLDVWPNAIPNDDPNQPMGTDYNTLVAILAAANKMLNASSLIHIGQVIAKV